MSVGNKTYTQNYTYSDGASGDGTITQMTAGNGEKITFTYDTLKRLSERVVKNGSTVVTTNTYGYKKKSTSGSTITTTGILESLEVRNKNGTALVDEKHTYDAVGNITHISKNTNPTYPLVEYDYGPQNQLIEEKYYDGSGTTDSHIITKYEYTYDTAGNILSESKTEGNNTTTKTYTYGNSQWIDLLTAFNGQPVVYEGQSYNASTGAVTGTLKSGNPIRYTNGQYSYYMEWSRGNQLDYLAFEDGYWQYQAGFAYDANGIRTMKDVDGTTHRYLTQNGKVIRETIGTGSTAKVLDFIYAESGKLFALNYSTTGGSSFTTYYYVLNLQGDVVKLINTSGEVVANYAYNAWGENLGVTDKNGNELAYDHIGNVNPLRYRGYYYDRETGLYYLQSRYYDPILHRFVNADTAEYSAMSALSLNGTNLFAYCQNNPVSFGDENGEWLNILIGAVVGAVVNAVTTAYESYKENGEIDWAGVGVSVASGAISGGLSAAGMGALGGAVASAIDSGYETYNNYKDAKENGTEWSWKAAAVNFAVDVGIGTAFGASGSGSKAALAKSCRISNAGMRGAATLFKRAIGKETIPQLTISAKKAVRKMGRYCWNTFKTGLFESGSSTIAERFTTDLFDAAF